MKNQTPHIIIAPDSFKGSCSAIEVANSIELGIKKLLPSCKISKLPIADGGEGTVQALILGAGGEIHHANVTDPMGNEITACYGILSDQTGVVELAAASGLPLVPADQRDAQKATTYGTGELILQCLNHGCKTIILGLGGSATTDAGVGLAQALGFSFLDSSGKEIGFGGGALLDIVTIDCSRVDARLYSTQFIIACDVTNPLCGDTGAAAIYGPQKGATLTDIAQLDNCLAHFATKVFQSTGKELHNTAGMGAAGGAALPLVAWFGASLRSGVDVVLDATKFEELCKDATLVITGEGRIDGQSVYGKVPVGVARRAKSLGLPVIAIVGGIGEGADAVYSLGIDAVIPCPTRPMSLEEAMQNAPKLINDAAQLAVRILQIGKFDLL